MDHSPPISPSTSPRRWPWLGLARFCLASIVAATHLAGFVSSKIIALIGSAAFEAILGFLAISGFSIAHSYQSRPAGYFRRRVLRIYPVFTASFVASLLVFNTYQGIQYPLFVILTNLVFLNGFVTPVSIVWGSWTLAIEVWLYCLAPFLARQTFRTINSFVWISFVVYVVYSCGRTLFHWPYYSASNWGIGFIALAFCWLAGWNLRTAPEESRHKAKWTLSTLYIGIIVIRFGIEVASRVKHHALGSGALELGLEFLWASLVLGMILILLFSTRLPVLGMRTRSSFSILGNISYPLYLIHLVAFTWASQLLGHNAMVLVIVALIASAVTYYIFDWYSQKREKPVPIAVE